MAHTPIMQSVKPHLTIPNLKKFIRSILALFIALILLVNTKTLSVMGQAGFFTAIVAIMIPPNMPVSLFMFATFTLLMGMLLGWAWGCAAMAAGVSARSATVLASSYEKAQVGVGDTPDGSFVNEIFKGDFLDPRSSTVFGIFFFFGCYAFAAIRAHIPKLSLVSVFATIVLDVMCSYGPLFPSAQYTLATLFLIPTSIYTAIGLSCVVLIFPESLAHVWLNGMIKGFLKPALALVKLQEATLSPEFPLQSSKLKPTVEQGKGLKVAMITATQGFTGQTGLLDLEPSFGRLGAGDLKKFNKLISPLMSKVFALQMFGPLLYDHVSRNEALETPDETLPSDKQAFHLRHTHVRQAISERESTNGHDLKVLLPILRTASADLRAALVAGLESVIEWLELVNTTRWSALWKRNKSEAAERETAKRVEMERRLGVLTEALDRFKSVERRKLVDGPFGAYFEERAKSQSANGLVTRDEFSAGSLFFCFVFTTTLESLAEMFISFFSFCIQVRTKRPSSRLWMPTGFGKLWRKITSDDGSSGSAPMDGIDNELGKVSKNKTESEEDEGEEKEEEEPILARDPDAGPPRTAFQRVGLKLGAIVRYQQSPQGLFCLRYALVSLCLWVIAIHPKTAYFNYIHRGLWALIMSQTGLGVFAGEQIFTFFIRISATVIGCVLGMVAWYIGAGNGFGNPYGVVASTLVFCAPFLFARIALPQTKIVFPLMTAVMIIFVVGYSWIDTHLAVTANSGVGYSLFWKRVLLVMIGFTAAFVIMCFPKITSARTTVRKTACHINEQIGGILEKEIEIFLVEARYGPESDGLKDAALERRRENRRKDLSQTILKTALALQSIQPSVAIAPMEPQLRGPWPKKTYERLLNTQWKLLIDLALLSGALAALEPRWCSILVHRTPFLNPDLITDVFSTLSLVTQCLYNGHPLPATMHLLRDRLIYHSRSRSADPTNTVHPKNLDAQDEEDDSTIEGSDTATEKLQGASIGVKTLDLETLNDPQFAIHATAIIALSFCLSELDEITSIVRELCGEASMFRGFDSWRGQNIRNEEEGLRSSFNRKKVD